MGVSYSSEDSSDQDRNLRFYRNEIRSRPWPGTKIEDMLLWFGKYDKLENNHNYIQWLFPTPEGSGMNSYAQPLTKHEAQAIRDDELASARVLVAYRMMLDFYGMRLLSDSTGIVTRNENWKDRYNHLNRSTHNYRRITRIIQSLGELGFERFQVPWITFLMEESIVRRDLPNLNGPCMKHWIGAIKEDKERGHMYENYLELFRKPKLGITAPPKSETSSKPSADTDENKIVNAEKVADNKDLESDKSDRQQNNVSPTRDFSRDLQSGEPVECVTYETVDTVDYGSVAESKGRVDSMPYIDDTNEENITEEMQGQCNKYSENVDTNGETVIAVGRHSDLQNDFCKH